MLSIINSFVSLRRIAWLTKGLYIVNIIRTAFAEWFNVIYSKRFLFSASQAFAIISSAKVFPFILSVASLGIVMKSPMVNRAFSIYLFALFCFAVSFVSLLALVGLIVLSLSLFSFFRLPVSFNIFLPFFRLFISFQSILAFSRQGILFLNFFSSVILLICFRTCLVTFLALI